MTTITTNHTSSYVEWSSVIAGTVVATAISFLLIQFGGGLGFAAAKEWGDDVHKVRWLIILTGVWLLWVQVSASIAGGYIAGRMRRPLADASAHESEVRDGAHGLLVWATGTVITMLGLALAGFAASLMPEHAQAAANHVDAAVAATPSFAKAASLISGFGMIATSAVSAVAAYWAGTLGGDHRDSGLDLSDRISFRRNRR